MAFTCWLLFGHPQRVASRPSRASRSLDAGDLVRASGGRQARKRGVVRRRRGGAAARLPGGRRTKRSLWEGGAAQLSPTLFAFEQGRGRLSGTPARSGSL